ncbi:hypothetical protein MD484_g717, partial [Candolleomyces efflorescens]
MEAIMGAYCRGIPIDFTPTYPPAIQAMEDRVAAYAAQGGGLVNPAPPAAVAVQPSDNHRHHHHDAATADAQPFFLSGPLDIARGYGCALCEDAGEVEAVCRCGEECEEELRVKEEPTSEHEDEDEIMRSTGSSAMSGISIVASSTLKSKGKGRAPQPPSDSPAQSNSAQAFLPPPSVYYVEDTPSASPTVPLGLPVSNPNPPTSFSTPEAAPLFYASGPDPLQAPQSQALATFTTSGLSVAATPMASPSATALMAPPPPPVRELQEIASKASVTRALIAQLPEAETGLQLLKNAMNALNCFILDLGLPHTPGNRVVGWNALFKRFQKRLARRGLSAAALTGSSKSTGYALAPRLKEKSSSSRKKSGPASTYEAVQSSSVYYSGAVSVSSRSGKSRTRDDVSVASTDSPAQTESLPYFALTVAIMAVGALNSPPVRNVRTDTTNKFGTVDHSESPSFLYALSQQALSVWMDDGQPLPAGVKDEQASTKDMRADFLRASLIGLHYLIANRSVASSIRFCTQSRKHHGPARQDLVQLMGKMVTAMRSWDFAEGLLSPSSLKAEERPEASAASAPSSRRANASRSKRGNAAPVQSAEPGGGGDSSQKEEVRRREKEAARIRVLWDFYFYDFILSDSLGEQSLIPASCYSIPLPSLPAHINSDEDLHQMDEDGNSSRDHDKAKEEIQRIRLEHVFLVQRALLTRLAATIKRNLSSPDCCCGHTLEQAVKMENSIKEWINGVPSELRWAFKHAVDSTPSELVAIGKTVLEDDELESQRPEAVARRRVLSAELALMSQLVLFKIFSPFVSEYLAKGSPTPEPQSSIATALRHLQTPAQAIIRISKLVHDVWEMAAQSKRGTFHTPPSLKPPLLELYPLEQLVLDATLVCSRICCGFVPDDPETDNSGMDRCDPCSSEMMLSIGMGLSLLENLHGTPQRGQSGRNSSSSIRSPSSVDVKLVELLRRRWESKSALLAPLEPLKRDRSTMEREDREGDEEGDVEIEEEGPADRMRRIDSRSDSGREESIRAEPQERSVPVTVPVDRNEIPRRASINVVNEYANIVPRHPAPPARLTPMPATTVPPPLVTSLLATAKAKKGKDKDKEKEKEKEKKKAKPVIRVRADGGTAQKVESMKPPPNPPFTRQPLPAKKGKTPGSADSPRNEYQPSVERPRYTPPTAMHPPPVPTIHSEITKMEYDNSTMGGPISSLPHPGMAHLPSNAQYGPEMNEPGSRGSYPPSYSSTDAMMSMAPSHYQGETHGLESSYATPHVDAYHHARHSYPPAPPTPVYGPPSHPPTPLSANPVRSAEYFGQQVDTQSSSSVYYVDQASYEPMRQQAPTTLQPYELSNQMPYSSSMSGHPDSSTGWSQPPDDMQNQQTHEQSYSWPPQHQHQQSAGW